MKKCGPHGQHPKQKIKTDPKLSKPFYFNKIPYALAEHMVFSHSLLNPLSSHLRNVTLSSR